MNRRQFLKTAALSGGAATILGPSVFAADKPAPSFVTGKSPMHLGTVTYNLAKDWDVPTIIKNCTETGFEGVELRTTHKHGVEIGLSKAGRAEVRKQFADSPVKLVSLGSIYDFHTPDQAKLRHDIDEAKQYILLAQDVGATGIKVRPNGFPAGVPKEKTIEQIGRSLRELGDFAKDHGQVVRLEVHGPETQNPPNIRKILDVANHPSVGACWNSNPTDLEGAGFDANFDLLKGRIFTVHLRDIYITDYPFRRLFARLKDSGFTGFVFAEIPETNDPIRVMHYFRSLFLAYQGLL